MSGNTNSENQQRKRRVAPSPKKKKKFLIPTTKHQCQTCLHRLTFHFINVAFSIADKAMYILGPILICLASAIILGLTYVYFRVVLPMMAGTNWIYSNADLVSYYNYDDEGIHEPNNENISTIRSIYIAILTPIGIINTTIVIFFLMNIIYNYYSCVMTSNSGTRYDIVVRELAHVTGFQYPETNNELVLCKKNLEKRIYDRMQRKRNELMSAPTRQQTKTTTTASGSNSSSAQAASSTTVDEESQEVTSLSPLMATSSSSTTNSNNNSTTTTSASIANKQQQQQQQQKQQSSPPQKLPRIHNWQLLSPTEWSYCRYSSQPKPPRSHYDHVTKSLVLNMDHYCPWMFNCIGYFNYRYFFNFLWWVTTALWYGAIICCTPFRLLGTKEYRDQVRQSSSANASTTAMNVRDLVVKHVQSNPYIPTPNERTAIALGFMLCLCLAAAVMCLAIFHLYLVVSAQTTIEFHGNWAKRKKKKNWINPYSAVTWRRTCEMIYGTKRYWSSTVNNNDDKERSSEEEDNNEKYRYRGCWGILMAMMPSNREPEFLPLPIDGKLIRRRNRRVGGTGAAKKSDPEDVEMGLSERGATAGSEFDDTEFLIVPKEDDGPLVERTARVSK